MAGTQRQGWVLTGDKPHVIEILDFQDKEISDLTEVTDAVWDYVFIETLYTG